MTRLLGTVAVVALVAACPALAQTTDTTTTTTTVDTQVSVQQQDADFVAEAARGGVREVELGKLAAEKAVSPEVKQFGQQMVDDHSKANDQLMQLAAQKGIAPPENLEERAKEGIDELADVSAEEFDREYMQLMVEDHEETIELFQEQAEDGEDAELKQFAADTLPKLQEHLQMAQTMTGAAVAEAEGTTATTTTTDLAATNIDENAETTVAVEQETETTVDPALVQASEDANAAAAAGTNQLTAESIIGQNVVNAEGREIGEIEDLVLDSSNQAAFAIVSVGGFLGMGDKDVALPLDRLQLGQDHVLMMSNVTEDELTQLPAYEPNDTDQYADYPTDRPLFGDQGTVGTAMNDTAATVDTAAEETAAAIGDAADETVVAVDNAAEQTGDAIDATTAEVQTTEEPAEPVDPALAAASGEATEMAAAAGMTSEDLIGKNIVNAEGEEIGEIKSLVLDNSNQAAFAIVSVGGFLGIGDKDVALPFDQLQLGAEEAILTSNVTEDQLKELPAFEPGEQYADVPADRTFFGDDATTEQAVGRGTDEAGDTQLAAVDPAAQLGQMRVDEVLGKDVFNADGEDIGEIEDLVVGQNQKIVAIVAVGGFLGIGERNVAVPLEQLTLGEDNAILMSNATKAELEGIQPWEANDQWTALPRDRQIMDQ